MLRMSLFAAALFAACSPPEHSIGSALAVGDQDAGIDGTADADGGAPPDVAPDAPVDCGSLCGPGDRIELVLIDPSAPITFRQDTVVQLVPIDSMGGELEVNLDVSGNFGTVGLADGAIVTIAEATPCLPDVREPSDEGDWNHCHVTVSVRAGHTDLSVSFFQQNGSQGWAVAREAIALVLH
jgi:hypothetical protein